jgi:hypothetical protein
MAFEILKLTDGPFEKVKIKMQKVKLTNPPAADDWFNVLPITM